MNGIIIFLLSFSHLGVALKLVVDKVVHSVRLDEWASYVP